MHKTESQISTGTNLIKPLLPDLEIKTQSTTAATPTCSHSAKTLQEQNLYDTYLSRLDGTVENTKQSKEEHDKKSISQPLTDAERSRIRERYSEKARERRLRMYEKAILLAEEREREEGKRYRLQRQLHFKVVYKTYFGQNVFVVGSAPPLGNWDAEKAIPLTWCPENSWTGSVTVSGDDGVVEYKYILKDTNSGEIIWEPGHNHKIDPAKLAPTSTLDDQWGKSG